MNEPFDPVSQDATVSPWTARAEVTRLTAWGVVGTTLLALAVRLALGPLPAWFIVLTLVLVAATAGVPVVLKRGGSPRASAVVVLASLTGLVASAAVVEGGLASPFPALLALLPVAASFLLGGRAAWVAGALACAAVGGLVVLYSRGLLTPAPALDEEVRLAGHALWICFTAVFIAGVAWLSDRQAARLNRKLRVQASVDRLTGLANRRRFEELLAEECRRATRAEVPVSVAIFDVDYFKSFNDTYGHPQGDRCLVAVAYAAVTCMRRAGEMLARYGGEEFIVLLPGSDPEQARRIGESIRRAVETLGMQSKNTEREIVTISVGVATAAGRDELEPDQLVRRADRALYKAKEGGRNRTEVAT